MKVFIEHRGSPKLPWLCLLAETLEEGRELEDLYWDAQSVNDNYVIDNNLEWQQDNHKLMFMLQVEEIPNGR